MSIEWTLLLLRLLAVAVLYAFLIVVVYVIWRDRGTAAHAQDQDPDVSTVTDGIVVSAARLLVVSSGDSRLQTGDVFDLRAHATLGRATDNHLVLHDTYVSSYHARLASMMSENTGMLCARKKPTSLSYSVVLMFTRLTLSRVFRSMV